MEQKTITEQFECEDGVKITVSCDIDNPNWIRHWASIYTKYQQQCEKLGLTPTTLDMDEKNFGCFTLPSVINRILEVTFLDGFFGQHDKQTFVDMMIDETKE